MAITLWPLGFVLALNRLLVFLPRKMGENRERILFNWLIAISLLHGLSLYPFYLTEYFKYFIIFQLNILNIYFLQFWFPKLLLGIFRREFQFSVDWGFQWNSAIAIFIFDFPHLFIHFGNNVQSGKNNTFINDQKYSFLAPKNE
jgi:hypothetical protein